jgi:IMP dehydrogenase
LTFDDVRLRTRSGHQEPLPDILDLTTRFSKNVDLKVPLVSAAMDTVTESEMAIAMAKLGGIGVIHAGLSIEQQKTEVRRVKHHLNGLILPTIRSSTEIAHLKVF